MAVLKLIEIADDKGQGSVISGNAQDARTVRKYLIQNPVSAAVNIAGVGAGAGAGVNAPIKQQDLFDTLNWLVGRTETELSATASAGRSGGLVRNVPACDPVFGAFWVRNVTEVRGIGSPQQQPIIVVNPGISPKDMPSWIPTLLSYASYVLTVEFGPRPYVVAPDSLIPQQTGAAGQGGTMTWKTSNGNTWQPNITYYPEWWRYTDYSLEPQNDWVTAQIGQLKFVRNDNAAPNGFPFSGQQRMFLAEDLVTINWYQVPRRYVRSSNSYLRHLRGLTNQYWWYENAAVGVAQPGVIGGAEFPPGSLLYLTFREVNYTAPFGSWVPWNSQVNALPQMVDLQMIFLRTDRYAFLPPQSDPDGRIVGGDGLGNFICHFHNALPWLGGVDAAGNSLPGGHLFYYVQSGATPPFISAPIPHLLFQDPDAPGAVPCPKVF